MSLFEKIIAWFAWPEYRNSLAGLVAYLPVGDLKSLIEWREKWIPYKTDTDPKGLDNYNGADLTIKAKGGDCESIAAVYSEVIRAWFGWKSHHVLFVFVDTTDGDRMKAHDVAFFERPDGSRGWINGTVHEGGYEAFRQYYDLIGWEITSWWAVNDTGDKI